MRSAGASSLAANQNPNFAASRNTSNTYLALLTPTKYNRVLGVTTRALTPLRCQQTAERCVDASSEPNAITLKMAPPLRAKPFLGASLTSS
jgi:hypothetical protein